MSTTPDALNAICPYYTMFPLDFPLRALRRQAKPGEWVLDPFCGRGTTNFAARLLGLPSFGVDSSPVAVALTRAKLADATASDVVRTASAIMRDMPTNVNVPDGEFWRRAYNASVLKQICWLRSELIRDCSSDHRILLRGILLGALHGPKTKHVASHLSNQCPRTFAPKPDYAVRFWKKNKQNPDFVDIIKAVQTRANRYLAARPPPTSSKVVLGDSRFLKSLGRRKFKWVITSPPYYGMRTYISDQWLRNWFLGGPSEVTYRPPDREISHASAEAFCEDLRQVWRGVAARTLDEARMVVRFGGIDDRKVNSVDLLKSSLKNTGWKLLTIASAGNSNRGRRQATQFVHGGPAPQEEHDFFAVRT